jgi:tetratricopeptide (TPR) repeat protein
MQAASGRRDHGDRAAGRRDRPERAVPRARSQVDEPPLPDEVSARELDRDVRGELRSLGRGTADTVARRLVAAGELLDVNPELALEHARAAQRKAPRVAAVREALGLAAYRCGQWQLALAELRAYHRMSGRHSYLAIVADCERGLGRPERAVDMLRHTDRRSVPVGEWVELMIVVAGARRDMGQEAAAVTTLQTPALSGSGTEPWRARLRYAYADALATVGRDAEAYQWFARAASLDPTGETGAAERLLELEGVVIDDNDPTVDDEYDEDDAEPAPEPVAHGTA